MKTSCLWSAGTFENSSMGEVSGLTLIGKQFAMLFMYLTANDHNVNSIAVGHLCLACNITVLAAFCKSLIFFSVSPFM